MLLIGETYVRSTVGEARNTWLVKPFGKYSFSSHRSCMLLCAIPFVTFSVAGVGENRCLEERHCWKKAAEGRFLFLFSWTEDTLIVLVLILFALAYFTPYL